MKKCKDRKMFRTTVLWLQEVYQLLHTSKTNELVHMQLQYMNHILLLVTEHLKVDLNNNTNASSRIANGYNYNIVIMETFAVEGNCENQTLQNLISTNYYNSKFLQPLETANNTLQQN